MRTYSEADRAKAIAMPGTAKEVGAALGIPRRTVSFWRQQYAEGQHTTATPLVEATRRDLAGMVRENLMLSLDRTREMLVDPNHRHAAQP
jgi:transposase-like protein